MGVALVGCGRKAASKGPSTSEGDALATVNGRAITEAEFQFEVQRRVASGRTVGSPESIVDALVEREVMLQAARKAGVLDEPSVRRELENQLLAQWAERTVQVGKDGITVTEEELRQLYQERMAELATPALVRLAILYRKVSVHDSEEKRAALRSELARGVAAFEKDRAAARQGGKIPGFGTVAVDVSEDVVSRYRGGDLGWLDPSRGESRLPAEVLAAGTALAVEGVSPVLDTRTGLYVVLKCDERAVRIPPFAEAAPALRQRVLRQRQDAFAQEFRNGLMAASRIRINAERAARLTVPRPPVPDSSPLPPVPALPVVP